MSNGEAATTVVDFVQSCWPPDADPAVNYCMNEDAGKLPWPSQQPAQVCSTLVDNDRVQISSSPLLPDDGFGCVLDNQHANIEPAPRKRKIRFASPPPRKRSRLIQQIEELIGETDEETDNDEDNKEALDNTVLLQMQMVAMDLQQRKKKRYMKIVLELQQENRRLVELVDERSKRYTAFLRNVVLSHGAGMRQHWDMVMCETERELQVVGM